MNPDVKSYCFETEDDAWEKIVELQDIASSNGFCTVADFKHVMGSGAFEGDREYGWTNLDDVSVERGKYGYYMVLPNVEEV